MIFDVTAQPKIFYCLSPFVSVPWIPLFLTNLTSYWLLSHLFHQNFLLGTTIFVSISAHESVALTVSSAPPQLPPPSQEQPSSQPPLLPPPLPNRNLGEFVAADSDTAAASAAAAIMVQRQRSVKEKTITAPIPANVSEENAFISQS